MSLRSQRCEASSVLANAKTEQSAQISEAFSAGRIVLRPSLVGPFSGPPLGVLANYSGQAILKYGPETTHVLIFAVQYMVERKASEAELDLEQSIKDLYRNLDRINFKDLRQNNLEGDVQTELFQGSVYMKLLTPREALDTSLLSNIFVNYQWTIDEGSFVPGLSQHYDYHIILNCLPPLRRVAMSTARGVFNVQIKDIPRRFEFPVDLNKSRSLIPLKSMKELLGRLATAFHYHQYKIEKKNETTFEINFFGQEEKNFFMHVFCSQGDEIYFGYLLELLSVEQAVLNLVSVDTNVKLRDQHFNDKSGNAFAFDVYLPSMKQIDPADAAADEPAPESSPVPPYPESSENTEKYHNKQSNRRTEKFKYKIPLQVQIIFAYGSNFVYTFILQTDREMEINKKTFMDIFMDFLQDYYDEKEVNKRVYEFGKNDISLSVTSDNRAMERLHGGKKILETYEIVRFEPFTIGQTGFDSKPSKRIVIRGESGLFIDSSRFRDAAALQ